MLRKLGTALLIGGFVLGGFTVAHGAATGPSGPTGETGEQGAPVTSWYVCKYVGTPGDTETLQTGQNPIFVDEHSIQTYPNVAIGDDFADAQGHSVVVAGPYAPPGLEVEPTCPTTTPTTPPPTHTPPPHTTPPPTVPPSPTEVPSPHTSTPPPPKCEGNGSDRPKCQPPVVTPPQPPSGTVAFTGASSATVPLGIVAGVLFLLGLTFLRVGNVKARDEL